ncbi:MAG TPA: LacI family transcriptional regulator [Firmicutes bacterium]|nr:LacI family transcriptional regulator [Bacillota bacterium]
MPVTIKDVARRSGVSKATVSRVLNNIPVVREDTRRAVLEATRALGYTPDALARGLTTKKTRTVALVVSDIRNPFFPEVARGVEDLLNNYNYNVMLCNTDGRPEKEEAYIRLLLEKRVDGIIFASVKMGASDLSRLQKRGLPFVLAGRTLPGADADVVVVDSVLGGYQATMHLLQLGHTRIGYVSGPAGVSASVDRHRGYEQALRHNGLDPSPELVAVGDFTQEGGYAGASRLLSLEKPPTAIFCANDIMAIGALEAIYERGLKVPEDVAIVGFDDIPFARLRNIQLTTVMYPKYDLGAIAARMLIERIENPAPDRLAKQVILPPRLIIRRTCGFHLGRSTPGATT